MKAVRWDPDRPFNEILITTDGAPSMRPVIKYISTRFFYANYHLLSVVNTTVAGVNPSNLLQRVLKRHMNEGLSDGARILEESGIEPKLKLVRGDPARETLRYIEHNGIDLLVIRTPARSGPPSLTFGSIGDVLARKADCPVLMVRGSGRPHVENILNPTDGRTHSIVAGEMSIALAKFFGARLVKFYVGDDEKEGRKILREAEEKAKAFGVKEVGRLEIVRGEPADIILEIANDFDMIVMGKGKRSLFRQDKLCMSSREVASMSGVPVLLVG